MGKAVVAALVALLVGPPAGLLSVAVLLNPAAEASCLPATAITEFVPSEVGSPPGAGSPTRVVFPLPTGTWVPTSGFGMRVHPITGVAKLHTGADYAAPAGTPILAVADGRVAYSGPSSGYGNLILIEHTVKEQQLTSGYAHMESAGLHVTRGDTVTAGQHIGDVGSSGYSTGPHLHFEVRPGGPDGAPVNPEPWLASRGASQLEGGEISPPGCAGQTGASATPYDGAAANGLVDDPTSDGRITKRTAHVLAAIQERFPGSGWACWSPRPGTSSEHPLGRACDGTFGNSIGTPATGGVLTLGWQVTNWLKASARALGVEYLIWQGRIWSVARNAEGWRPYDGGGMHDARSVTGGHYDHVHFTVIA